MELFHHGVKGQRWGVKNGPPYPLTKVTKGSEKTSNEIYRSLSKYEKQLVNGQQEDETPPNVFIKKGEAKYLVDQVLIKYGNTPVTALDIWNQEQGEAAISIMTKNDERYRGKGFGDRAVKEGIKAFENAKDVNILTWGVWDKNEPSKRLAENNGFKLVDYHDPGGEKYLIYQRTKGGSSNGKNN